MTDKYKLAVVRTGGKQYFVAPGSRVSIDRVDGKIGDSITLGDVLILSSGGKDMKVGTPTISGASVKAKILSHKRAEKKVIYKKRIKSGYTKKQGHRQNQTQLLIESISA